MRQSWIDLLQISYSRLKDLEEAKAISNRLIEELSGSDLIKLQINNSYPEVQQIRNFETCIERLSKGEPLQYVLGYEYFMDMKLKVNPSVLIPRPETEELVIIAKSFFISSNPKKAIDFCTGSGCIALGVKKISPNIEIWATDISKEALITAESNAIAQFGQYHSIRFIEHDLLNNNSLPDSPQFDLIISNPPYITEKEAGQMSKTVLEFEPHIALFAQGSDALIFYKSLLQMATKYLSPTGFMLCEINPLYSSHLKKLGDDLGFESVIIKDMIGKERFWKISNTF
ncbi:MAG: peptide chain release factor N(5)-glutamine methyltransferase [Bacteroidetes bacterium]|nr:peptide chain release factor N(5)-glutamine methyltransferase [Bacteroidota bacterium]